MSTMEKRLAVFEADIHAALRSWHSRGGRHSGDPAVAEMPFDEMLMRERERADSLLSRYASGEPLSADEMAELRETYENPDEFARQASQHELDGEPGEYEWRQRILGVKMLFRWILAEGFVPLKIMKRLWAVGRAMNVEPFTQLTMNEQGQMFGETKAAASWRMKVLSGLIKLCGMRGYRLAGQKTDRASEAARKVAMGNTNRANGHARQSSFLRKLHVPKL
jgi:hypothetical protein